MKNIMRYARHFVLLRRVVCVILLLAIVLVPVARIEADSAALRRQLAEVEQERAQARAHLRAAQGELAGVRDEIDELLDTMYDYSLRMAAAMDELDAIEAVLLEVEAQMEEAEEQLEEAIAAREIQYAILRSRLREMYMQGPVGYLEVLFQSSSFADFFARMEYVRAIARFDQEVFAAMQAAEDRVANIVDDLARLTNSITNLFLQQQDVVYQLEEIETSHAAWLISLQENEELLDALAEVEAMSLLAIEAEFARVQRELRAAEEAEEAERRRVAAAAAAAENAARLARLNDQSGNFQWPVPTHSRISSYFGSRRHPISGRQETHWGIDIPAPQGTRIIAAADGYVRFSGWQGGFGNTVIIDHANGYSTLYAHNVRNHVTAGQRVTRGQHIADVGTTGVSTGPHLHFEIRRGTQRVNPLIYFPNR